MSKIEDDFSKGLTQSRPQGFYTFGEINRRRCRV